MTKRVGRLVIGGISVACLLGAAWLTPASADQPNPAPDPKTAAASRGSLPLDITGDAALSEERDRFRDTLKPLAAYDGGTIWDGPSRTLTVQLTSGAAIQKARTMTTRAAKPFSVNYVQVKYTANELEALSAKLLDNQVKWAGASGIGGGYDPAKNRVILQVDPKYKEAPRLVRAIKKLKDPRITLEYIKAVEGSDAESRDDDFAPWSVGAIIDAPEAEVCTLGWAWKMWGTNEIVGSTARHCRFLNWYNKGTYVGTVFKSAKSVDSAFMHGSTYARSVFVGDEFTNDLRPVVGIDTAWVAGESVAMSANSGLFVSTVQLPTYTLPSCSTGAGLKGVLMKTDVSMPGDSGGPWLTTQSGSGDVIAHGQHWGDGCADKHAGSFFIKLTDISAAQGASLYIH
ncbi:S1 family peptidase [Kribbella sp. NBC_01245]|uniref:hypothetical protein n=1 Tax=Kribbella sp. NBC_01245 TaxID=2903578 RepID=UPI002E2DFE70|nr:hypothetical protein [Kribbella sp. NBC_01245]